MDQQFVQIYESSIKKLIRGTDLHDMLFFSRIGGTNGGWTVYLILYPT